MCTDMALAKPIRRLQMNIHSTRLGGRVLNKHMNIQTHPLNETNARVVSNRHIKVCIDINLITSFVLSCLTIILWASTNESTYKYLQRTFIGATIELVPFSDPCSRTELRNCNVECVRQYLQLCTMSWRLKCQLGDRRASDQNVNFMPYRSDFLTTMMLKLCEAIAHLHRSVWHKWLIWSHWT